MTILHAVILGAIQGLAEFIPISSSAHLLVVPWLFGWTSNNPASQLTFDVALHFGTTVALLAYFGKDWSTIIVGFLRGCRTRKDRVCNDQPDNRGFLVIPVVLACIPAAVVGLRYEGVIESRIRESAAMPVIISVTLVVMGVVLYLADYVGKQKRTVEQMTMWDCIVVGLAQALALIPGVSRSGSTITAGLFLGLKREDAAYFSFLLSAPIILGASAVRLMEIIKHGLPHGSIGPFAAGMITSAIVGYACIAFLMKYLKKHGVGVFVIYRLALAAVIMLVYFLR